MKKITALFLMLILALTLTAQDEPSAEEQAAAQKAWMEFMTPADEHKDLANGAGEWIVQNTYWFTPGAEPTVTEGSAVGEMIMGGRYLKTIHTGTVMGMPFEGMSLEAYDNAADKYISIWIDNLGTSVAYAEGAYNEESGKIVYEGSMTDPMTKEPAWFKQTVEKPDENTIKFEMFMKGQDGSDFKNMEILFTRK